MINDINKHIGNKIRYYRKKNKLTLKELAERLNISRSTLNHYELGNREADKSILFQIATLFEISIDELFPSTTDDNYIPVNMATNKTIQVYGRISAGNGITAYEDKVEQIICPYPYVKGDLIALQVVGESMNMIIPNGSYAILKRQKTVENGQIAAVIIDNEDAVLKRFYRVDNDMVVLRSESTEKYDPIILECNDINKITIVGKYIGHVSPYVE